MARLEEFDEIIKRNEPLAPYMHLRLGGPAEMLVQPRSLDVFVERLQAATEQFAAVPVGDADGNVGGRQHPAA